MDGQPLAGGERQKLRGKLLRGLRPELPIDGGRAARFEDARALALSPRPVPLEEAHRVGLRAATRNGDAQIPVGPDAHHVAPRPPHADEVNPELFCLKAEATWFLGGRRQEREPQLHVTCRDTC